MFDFVEQPVTIRNSEYPMYNDRPNRVVMQGGLQPVTAPLLEKLWRVLFPINAL